MRFLMVGAGGVGGYFGGRLIEKGEDVTFLVRENRKAQLNESGIVIRSIHGDYQSEVKTIVSGEAKEVFDVVVITVKAYHLQEAIKDIKPYVGENTVIISLLNGYNHYQVLKESFGEEKVVGGLCFIETTITANGDIVQTSGTHNFVFGEWDGVKSERAISILEHLDGANFNCLLSENIQMDIWNKYIFIATMSGVTTLMRSPIGPILADEYGKNIIRRLLDEIVSIVRDSNHQVDKATATNIFDKILSLTPSMKSSMQRDMEKNGYVEADHFHGALLEIAKNQGKDLNDFPILQTVYSNLKVYESLL